MTVFVAVSKAHEQKKNERKKRGTLQYTSDFQNAVVPAYNAAIVAATPYRQ